MRGRLCRGRLNSCTLTRCGDGRLQGAVAPSAGTAPVTVRLGGSVCTGAGGAAAVGGTRPVRQGRRRRRRRRPGGRGVSPVVNPGERAICATLTMHEHAAQHPLGVGVGVGRVSLDSVLIEAPTCAPFPLQRARGTRRKSTRLARAAPTHPRWCWLCRHYIRVQSHGDCGTVVKPWGMASQ